MGCVEKTLVYSKLEYKKMRYLAIYLNVLACLFCAREGSWEKQCKSTSSTISYSLNLLNYSYNTVMQLFYYQLTISLFLVQLDTFKISNSHIAQFRFWAPGNSLPYFEFQRQPWCEMHNPPLLTFDSSFKLSTGKIMLCSSPGCNSSFPNMQKLMDHVRQHYKPNIYFQ